MLLQVFETYQLLIGIHIQIDIDHVVQVVDKTVPYLYLIHIFLLLTFVIDITFSSCIFSGEFKT